MKKYKRLYFYALVFWSALTSVVVLAGHEVSNGVDLFAGFRASAWFVGGERTIKYCVEVADDFGLDRRSVLNEIESAFRTWTTYYNERVEPVRADRHLRLATKTQFFDACTSGVDLHFLFGLENDAIRKARGSNWGHVALALQTEGVIWIGKQMDGMTLDRTHLLLSHELGHVFGNDHIQGTIMDTEEVVKLLFAKKFQLPEAKRLYRSIDQSRQLAQCRDCPFRYEGKLGRGDSAEQIFKLLMGRSSVGKTEATVVGRDASRVRTLEVRDQMSSRIFNIEYGTTNVSLNMDLESRIFGALSERTNDNGVVVERSSVTEPNLSWVDYGKLKTTANKSLFLILEMNLLNQRDSGPIGIKTMINDTVETVFWIPDLAQRLWELERNRK